jgi:hypothetical protein
MLVLAAAAWAGLVPAGHATTVAVTEDVMTSSFFSGANLVRGYAGDNRPVMRVSTDGAFGVPRGETIYLDFGGGFDFAALAGPVKATLTMQSTPGGFGADAGPGNPFLVSVHAVAQNPFTAIRDDTNPAGPLSWTQFYDSQILPSDAAARTSIEGFGAVTFDVSGLVDGWRTGANPILVLAVTGLDDTSGNDFLHGFLNNTEQPGSTFLTLSPVPEPRAALMLALGLFAIAVAARRRAAEASRRG